MRLVAVSVMMMMMMMMDLSLSINPYLLYVLTACVTAKDISIDDNEIISVINTCVSVQLPITAPNDIVNYSTNNIQNITVIRTGNGCWPFDISELEFFPICKAFQAVHLH